MKQLLCALKLIGGLNYNLIGIFQTDEIKVQKVPFVPRRALSLPGECLTWLLDTVGCHPDVYYPLVPVYRFLFGRSE